MKAQASQLKDKTQQRLDLLERQVDALRDQVIGLKPVKKNWRRAIGLMPDNEISRSAARLGEQWRKRQKQA